MAALSVQYSNAGIKTFQPLLLPNSCKPVRNPLLALTPPAIQIFVIPVSSDAFFNLFNRILIIRSCIDAQISGRLLSINCCLSDSVARNDSLYTFDLPAFCKKYNIDVFNPEKLKSRPSILGSGNLNAFGLPCFAYLSTNGPPGYGSPSSLADLSNASPAASSIVWPITSSSEGDLHKTICVCPPLTVKHKKGNYGFGSLIRFASTCACIW